MSRRLLLDPELGREVIEALRRAGHDVDCVSDLFEPGLLDDIFAFAGLDDRAFVTVDPNYADVRRFEVAASPGLIVFCLRSNTLNEALDRIYEAQLEELDEARRSMAELARAARRDDLLVSELERSSASLYEKARLAIVEHRRDDARSALAARAENYLEIRRLREEGRQLHDLERTLVYTTLTLQAEVEAFRGEKEAMKVSSVAARVAANFGREVEGEIEAITANLIEALATRDPRGRMWLVEPDATWEVPTEYLRL